MKTLFIPTSFLKRCPKSPSAAFVLPKGFFFTAVISVGDLKKPFIFIGVEKVRGRR